MLTRASPSPVASDPVISRLVSRLAARDGAPLTAGPAAPDGRAGVTSNHGGPEYYCGMLLV